jgi:hypothetical protein
MATPKNGALERETPPTPVTNAVGTTTANVRPYHVCAQAPDESWMKLEIEVLGFDARRMHRALDAWCATHNDERSTKAEAVELVRRRLVALKQTWAAERIADRRWQSGLTLLRKTVDEVLPLARVRCIEEGRLGSSTEERAAAVERLAAALAAAATELAQLEAMHTWYRDDPLAPVVQRGKGPKTALGEVETILRDGGFSYEDIGAFSGFAASAVRQRVAAYRKRVEASDACPPSV